MQETNISTLQRSVSGVALLLGALSGLLATGAPTGISWWDGLLRSAGGAAVAWMCTRLSPRWWLVVLPPLAIYTGPSFPWPLIVASGLAAVVLRWLPLHLRALASGGIGTVLVWILHTLPDRGFFGSSAAMSALAVTGVFLASRQIGTRDASVRSGPAVRTLRRVALGACCLVAVVSAVGVLSLRASLNRAASQAEVAAELTSNGNFTQAAVRWEASARSFADAAEAADSPLLFLARGVPVASQHLRVGKSVADVGQDLTRTATALSTALGGASWRLPDGTLDTESFTTVATELTAASTSMFDAEIELQESRDPWVLAAFDGRIAETVARLGRARSTSESAAEALQLLPDALGSTVPRTYLIVFANPAEAREMGGLLSAYAIVRFDQGRLSLETVGPNDDLIRTPFKSPVDTTGHPLSYRNHRVEQFPLNLTGTPDLQLMFATLVDLFPDLGGGLDGVIYLDPFAIEAMVGLGRPLDIPGSEERIDGTNTASFLLRDQYLMFDTTAGRDRAFAQLLTAALPAFEQRLVNQPSAVVSLMAPLTASGHMQAVTNDPRSNHLLADTGLLPSFAQKYLQGEATDFLSVMSVNQGQNKLDAFITREIVYDVTLDPSGSLEATVEVALTSAVPADLPDVVTGASASTRTAGAHRMAVVVYSPHALVTALVDGQRVSVASNREYGLWRHAVPVSVDAQTTMAVTFALAGHRADEASYGVEVWRQPLSNMDRLTVNLTRTDARTDAGMGVASTSGDLAQTTLISFDAGEQP